MSSGVARLSVRVSGRVQGVGYRFFAVSEATARNLVGYARNLRDGDVEIVAEGPREALESFLAALAKGPRASRVETVQPVWEDVRSGFKEFGIRWDG
jgi:acylphosphatase